MIARFALPFFLLMAFVIVPLAGCLLFRRLLPRRWANGVCISFCALIWGTSSYGLSIGFQQFRVRTVTLVCPELPPAFDGYRIVQFSDAHVGTLSGSREWMLRRAVDSILAQHPDMIVFTGDLQNVYPTEITPHLSQLRRLKAPDGMFSVLGNHDYAVYQPDDSLVRLSNCCATQTLQRKAGWTLLLNSHHVIRRGTDSLVIAGMENWGVVKRMPRRGDVARTLTGVDSTAFVVMLQHDPTAWREKILPECRAQVTLSGHTHGGQVSIMGWSPVALSYREWSGTTYEGSRVLHVSTGLGGLIPFRLGLPGEIVVITLRKSR